jgi:formylglycine-generating enzyme required for sulfatase activity
MQLRTRRLILIASVIILTVACSLPFLSSTPVQAPSETAIAPLKESAPTKTVSVPEIEPVAATVMRWIDRSDFVFVPAGEFTMGEDKPAGSDHAPAHQVNLGGFWIQQTEVTNRQYAECVALGVCASPFKDSDTSNWFEDPSRSEDPVVAIAWSQAQTYCEWIDARLPTEAEWEKAARGTDGNPYPWGEAEPTCDLLNFKGCLDPSAPAKAGSYPAGASPDKLLDTAGNVSEWVQDWYTADYYTTSSGQDPTGPAEGTKRVVRGSSFQSKGDALRVTLRTSLEPEKHRPDLGFRCVLSGSTPPPACEVTGFTSGVAGISQASGGSIKVAGTFCIGDKSNQTGGITLDFGEGSNAEGASVTVNDKALKCEFTPNRPERLTCYSTPDHDETIKVCPAGQQAVQSPIQLVCGQGYVLDPTTGTCRLKPLTYSSNGCPPEYVDVPGYGCLLRSDGTCPAGFFHYALGGNGVCAPAGRPNGCMFNIVGVPNCAPGTCIQGLTYHTEGACCQNPKGPSACPTGYSYDPQKQSCEPAQSSCVDLDISIPACPTPTPKRGFCSQFNGDGAACRKNGCVFSETSLLCGGH